MNEVQSWKDMYCCAIYSMEIFQSGMTCFDGHEKETFDKFTYILLHNTLY